MSKRVPQAERSKQDATDNIERKISILTAWSAKGIPYQVDDHGHYLLDANKNMLLDFYPTSLRTFKEWDGSQNCSTVRLSLPKISRVGNDTLAKRPQQERTVSELIVALKSRAAIQIAAGRHGEIKRLSSENKILESLLKIGRAEFRAQRLDLLSLRKKHDDMVALRDREAEQYAKSFQEKDAEIESLKLKIAELVVQQLKIAPLRKAQPDDQQ